MTKAIQQGAGHFSANFRGYPQIKIFYYSDHNTTKKNFNRPNLLKGQSETLKDQNGVDFNFQSTYMHHISLSHQKTLIWRS